MAGVTTASLAPPTAAATAAVATHAPRDASNGARVTPKAQIIGPSLWVYFNTNLVSALKLASGPTDVHVELDGILQVQIAVFPVVIREGLRNVMLRVHTRPVVAGKYHRGWRKKEDEHCC